MILVGCAVALGATLVCAKDFWEKPYTKWSKKDVLKMLSDSPWADEVTITRQQSGRQFSETGTSRSSGTGEKEYFDSYTVRLFTALPIRQAYIRMVQLMNNYDGMKESEQVEFDKRFQPALHMDTSKQVIVNLDFSTNDNQLRLDVQRTLQQTTADQLKQSAFLISDRFSRIPIEAYYPPSPDGTGAKFCFPRQVDGQPVATPEDKDLKFELYVPGTDHKVFVSWKVSKLMFDGELAY